MYDIMLTNCTTNLCAYLLSLLEEQHENTDFIRHVWQTQGIGNSWCVYKCLEIINREHYDIPTEDCEQYHIHYIERNK